MKITISTFDDIKNPYYGGGGAIATHELAKSLSLKNIVEVISWNHSNIRYEIIDNVHYNRVGVSFLNPKVSMLLFQICLPFIAIQKTYDVWIESFGPPLTTSFLSLFIKKPIIGIVHMLASEDMVRKYKISLFSFIEKLGISKYKNIVVTTGNIAKQIAIMNKYANITIISNGVTIMNTNIMYRKKAQILFLGRIEVNQKGLDLLIDIFNKVKKANPEF